jgi:hypothetical protein
MSSGNPNPFEIACNGEPASLDEIRVMEQLALGFVQAEPAEFLRQYGYCPTEGSAVLFGTRALEEDGGEETYARVSLLKSGYNDLCLTISFGYDSCPDTIYANSDDDLVDAAMIAEELIDSGELDLAETAVVRHVQMLALSFLAGDSPHNLGVWPNPNPEDQQVYHVADTVRNLVHTKTAFTTIVREFGVALDDEHTLIVLHHAVKGDVIPEEVSDLPEVQVEYEDRAAVRNHCFTRGFNGMCRLVTFNPLDELNDEESLPEPEVEEEIAAFRSECGMDRPGKADVQLLTEKLVEIACKSLVLEPSDATEQ